MGSQGVARGRGLKIEAVTICVNYGDFLAECIPYNRVHFDRWLIVTSPADMETRELCRRYNMECLVTDDFYRDGSEFNKGAAIDRGMNMMAHDGWMMHLDADIVLPTDFRESFFDAHLDPECIYGVDRFIVPNWEAWQKFKPTWLARDYHSRVTFPGEFKVGARWADVRHGWCPIGFAQILHPETVDRFRGTRTRRYPHHHNDACRADVQFAIQWDRRKRHLIPEIIVAHLESEPAPVGANWKGRTTKRFGPPLPPGSGNKPAPNKFPS